MKLGATLTAALALLALLLMATGCSDVGTAAPIGRQTHADIEHGSAAPAVPPAGTSARHISYRCGSGREGTLLVDVPDLGTLADRINRIQPCEYDKGLSRATLTVTCRSRPRVVPLTGTGGLVEQPTSEALCAR